MNQSELTDKVVLKYIGKCPVCGKGRMLQGSAGWTCNHFKDWEDKCDFTIFGMYSGHIVTEEEALSLINDGTTGMLDFVSKDGNPFTGTLRIADGKVKVFGSAVTLDTVCPLCGGKVRKVRGGWSCANSISGKCRLFIPCRICSRDISPAEAETLLSKGYTEILDGFSYNGKDFSSCLVLDKDGTCRMDGKVAKCPKCGGDVYAGAKAYNCSNFRNKEINCRFGIWRTVYGHAVTVDEVRTLCRGGRTGLIDFHARDGSTMARSMQLDDKYNIRLI